MDLKMMTDGERAMLQLKALRSALEGSIKVLEDFEPSRSSPSQESLQGAKLALQAVLTRINSGVTEAFALPIFPLRLLDAAEKAPAFVPLATGRTSTSRVSVALSDVAKSDERGVSSSDKKLEAVMTFVGIRLALLRKQTHLPNIMGMRMGLTLVQHFLQRDSTEPYRSGSAFEEELKKAHEGCLAEDAAAPEAPKRLSALKSIVEKRLKYVEELSLAGTQVSAITAFKLVLEFLGSSSIDPAWSGSTRWSP